MNKKRFPSLFLAICLLIVPVTSSYAAFFSNWTQYIQVPTMDSISHLVDKDTAKKLFPLAILATLIGFWYWKNKKSDDNDGRDISATPTVPVTGVSPEVVVEAVQKLVEIKEPALEQLPVYGQFNSDGGGGASCGYQTLLRAMQLVREKSLDESDIELKKTLMNPVAIQVYFGPEGEWRKAIIEKRKADEFKKVLHKKLLAALKSNDNSKAVDLYKSSLGFLEDYILEIVNDPNRMPLSYDFTDDAIKQYISAGLKDVKSEDSLLIQKLQNPKEMNNFFDFNAMKREVLSSEAILRLPELFKQIIEKPEFTDDFRGEWLSDGEVEFLWKYEKEKRDSIVPKNVSCGFKAIANFELIGQEGFDEVAPYVDEKVKPLFKGNQQLFQIFALGTMRQSGDIQGTRGHWYPLVMHQHTDGNRKYYIMDSADTTNVKRLDKNDNARKIINLIEN